MMIGQNPLLGLTPPGKTFGVKEFPLPASAVVEAASIIRDYRSGVRYVDSAPLGTTTYEPHAKPGQAPIFPPSLVQVQLEGSGRKVVYERAGSTRNISSLTPEGNLLIKSFRHVGENSRLSLVKQFTPGEDGSLLYTVEKPAAGKTPDFMSRWTRTSFLVRGDGSVSRLPESFDPGFAANKSH